MVRTAESDLPRILGPMSSLSVQWGGSWSSVARPPGASLSSLVSTRRGRWPGAHRIVQREAAITCAEVNITSVVQAVSLHNELINMTVITKAV